MVGAVLVVEPGAGAIVPDDVPLFGVVIVGEDGVGLEGDVGVVDCEKAGAASRAAKPEASRSERFMGWSFLGKPCRAARAWAALVLPVSRKENVALPA